jgi:hypothetical protein
MTADATTPERTWSANTAHVRKAIAFLRKRKGGVTAEELVTWDLENGRRLFTWNDEHAATSWREHEARLFMNRFRGMFDKMRVRAFIHVKADADADIDRSAYFTVEAIAEHPGMRDQVVRDIVRRMKTLASELAMWKLSDAEQAIIFSDLRAAMSGTTEKKAVA